jgi:hypothetical protein
LPTVTANASGTTVCAGNSVTLTGGGATTYTWSGGVTNVVSFVPTATTTYTVTGTDINGCSNTATQTITVDTLPTVTANATSTSVCAGNSVTLTGGGATNYTWSSGVTDGVSFVPTATTTYTVTGTNAVGCTNTATKTIIVNTLPTVTANASAAIVCLGNSVILSGGGASFYIWTGGVSDAVSFIPLTNSTYTVTGTDLNGCTNSANTTITVNPTPTVIAQSGNQTVGLGSNIQISVSSSLSSATYQWQTNLGIGWQNLSNFGQYNGATNDTLTITNTTLSNNNQPFRCIISSSACSDTSSNIVLTIDNNVGIIEATKDNLFSIYPNPAKNQINIKVNNSLLGTGYYIYDNNGKIVLSGKINSEISVIELGYLSGGIYILSFGDNIKQTFQIIKE